MLSLRDIAAVVTRPQGVLAANLDVPPTLSSQLWRLVLPAVAIRSLAVLLRSLLLDAPTTAVVLAVGSLALQVGTWAAVGLALPALARQFEVAVSDRQATLIVALASCPLWLAGPFFAVPETSELFFYWSRSLVLAVSLYGLYIAHRAFTLLGARAEARLPLTAMLGAIYVALYFVLFTLIGISSHLVLFLWGAT